MKILKLSAAVSASLAAFTAEAATISVTSSNGGTGAVGDCTLNEAIESANNNVGTDGCVVDTGVDAIDATAFDINLDGNNNVSGDLIDLSGIAGATVTLTGALPTIDSNITIQGAGTIIDGNNSFRVLRVGNSNALAISSLTLRNGAANRGGGLYGANFSQLAVDRSTITGNTVTIEGGGIHGRFQSRVSLRNSTLYANSANNRGGAISVAEESTLNLSHVTITGNNAGTMMSGGSGGGIYSSSTTTLTVDNSILTGNTVVYDNIDCTGAGVRGYFTNSIVGTSLACDFQGGVDGNLSIDPELGTLADNGGATQTMKPLVGSPAIDLAEAVNGSCDGTSIDQRGGVRPRNGRCDVGAVETEFQVDNAIVVNTLAVDNDGTCGDDGSDATEDCSLREAITLAKLEDSPSSISFADAATLGIVPGNTARMEFTENDNAASSGSNALPRFTGEISVDGPTDFNLVLDPATSCTINGVAEAGERRLGMVDLGASLTISNVTVEGGCADGTGTATLGGGMFVDLATLMASNATFSGNTADFGGGIYGYNSTIALTASTISGNSATFGGGASSEVSSVLDLERSTFYGNTAGTSGGALFWRNGGTVTINNSTIAGNTSSTAGDGLYAGSGVTLSLSGAIVANGGSNGDCFTSGAPTVNVTDSLLEDGSCGVTNGVDGNLIDSPLLGTLQDNGGPTLTLLPQGDSPAVDSVTSSNGMCGGDSADQRGLTRPVDANGLGDPDCDLGAVEVLNDPVTPQNDPFIVSEDSAIVSGTDTDGQTTPGDSSDDGVLVNDDATDDEDQGTTVTGFAGISAGQTLNLTSGANVTINADGSFNFDGAGQYEALGDGDNDVEVIEYTASDGFSSETGSLIVRVTGVNDAPAASAGAFSVAEGSLASATFPASDVDQGDSLSFSFDSIDLRFTDNTNGTFSFDASGAEFESLGAGESTDVVIGFTATDGANASDTGAITMSVNGINDAPVASPVAELAANEDGPNNGSFNATDVDDTVLGYTVTTQPAQGIVTPTGPGATFSFDPQGQFESLDTGEDQLVTYTYRVEDPDGLSDTADGTVRVAGANDAPVAGDDSYGAERNQPLLVDAASGLLANDTDIDTSDATSLAVLPATVVNTGGIGGSLTASADGSFAYTPPTDTAGEDRFGYEVSDGNEQTSGEVTIRVGLDNLPPQAVDDTFSLDENGSLSVPAPGVLDNDSDPETNPLTVTSTGTFSAQGIGGTVLLQADGSVDYTPPPATVGQATLLYTITDGFGGEASAIATFNVNNVDDAPNAVDDLLAPIAEDSGTVTIPFSTLLTNDDAGAGDSGDSIEIVSVQSLQGGQTTLQAGAVEFAPENNFFGDASFSYTIEDDAGAQANATVTIPVTGINDPPSFSAAGDQNFAPGASGVRTIDAFVTDISPGMGEDDQDIIRLSVEETSDPGGVVQAASLDASGRLELVLSGASGTAELQAVLQDSGGTANGGADTSEPRGFRVTVGNGADLIIRKTTFQTNVAAGDALDYVITVSNEGPADVVGARVADQLPPEVINAEWACVADGQATCNSAGTGSIDESINLAQGSSVTFLLMAEVAQGENSGSIENTATVVAPAGTPDFDLSSNSATASTAGPVIFQDGFEAPMTAKRFSSRRSVIMQSEIRARLGEHGAGRAVFFARDPGSTTLALVVAHARLRDGELEVRLSRLEGDTWTLGSWSAVTQELLYLEW
ncbi:MAG: Ig-like domain-containing protein [Pseudomonadota bacterium]